ncbi:S9 family peptidase [Chitinophaga pinensis]|uniref:Peptidase S9 prolyl oligopeptidase active site domain protein n=1 Tax=Chitinophaga pinensis (strain ATCC 43595 / DSM 2588 / LMG 13176 / NBRC 15968 / NCIMB 11800 / UQM 2034) TaxID=485918 RepID=A0A979GRY2_CHIPD|nr:prolyl oligopeptidase family serine peptidase [Chitinophaga pinensis]ACU57560.1 peptidase S9 prolyl oligopeptidase active site domain protein [Chitinophaga pinensis DSM 2588]
MTNNSLQQVPGVKAYTIAHEQLLLQQEDTLRWIDLETGHTRFIWPGSVNQLAADGHQLAFFTDTTLRYYQPGMDSAIVLDQHCAGGLQFSNDGKYLQYQLSLPVPAPTEKLRIWNYQDYYLQTPPAIPTTMIVCLASGQSFIVNLPGTQIAWQHGGRYIITQNSVNHQEYYWNKKIINTLYLVDTHTGIQKKITANTDKLLLQPSISPNERFMTWYDHTTAAIYSYEIASGHIRKLIKGIGVAQWSAKDSVVFIHSDRDVWQIDPSGERPPVKLTNGKQQHMIFRQVYPDIFVSFDTRTKANGFWKWEQGKLHICTMEDRLFYMPVYPLDQYPPVKAKDTSVYLVTGMRDGTSPDLFVTKDFQHFTSFTKIHPEERYNWLRVTLTKHGLLYQPQDFDPAKKYPVIFHYYEGSKDYLHRFITPALSEGTLNIPWYVSNGYMVFVPHIITKQRHPGRSAARAVIRAAKYLSTFGWVNKERMGLQGHSFGGYVTNYVITHTQLFAAAQASAGPTDFISGYGAIRKSTGTAMQQLYEQGQNKMGRPPWEIPRLYLKNSPVIRVNKVHTPLLLMHNDNDNAVPFAQGIELYTALRRLQKKVWLLQYRNEGHQLFRDPDKLDFTIRQQQFFDHYLKDKPMPDWMKAH